MAADTPQAEVVTVSLQDLKNGTVPFATLKKAFGPDSLGILVVKDVAPEFVSLRHRTLSYASYLANLPKDELAAKFLTGWSRGKETLKAGQVDDCKGSYYTNCAFYVDPEREAPTPTAEFTEAGFPEYLAPNVWPSTEVLPGFRDSLQELCRLLIDTAVLVARACDRFAEKELQGYPPGYVERMVQTSATTKARLLHYFPLEEDDSESVTSAATSTEDDQWCTTHLDHGCLTALTSAMYVDESAVAFGTGQTPALTEIQNPDPAAGLYIKSRTGQVVQVHIPKDCIAFQTGEALERITGGQFKAVPHFVRGIEQRTSKVSTGQIVRNTLAVFTQPNLDEEVDREKHLNFGQFSRLLVAKNTVY